MSKKSNYHSTKHLNVFIISMKLNLETIKDLVVRKYKYADFIFKEVLPETIPVNVRCSVPQLQQVSNGYSHEEQSYRFVVDSMYNELIKSAIKDRHEKETRVWFSTKFAEFSFSEIIRKSLLALNEGDYKYIILPKSVYDMFLSSEMDVYANILREGNFNKTKIKFNSIVPPFFKDSVYNHINAYFIDGINDIYLLSNEIFDIRKTILYEMPRMGTPMLSQQEIAINVQLNSNFIHKIEMYQNDQVLSNHLKLKKIKAN